MSMIQDKETLELIETYRRLFNTHDGKVVLTNMLFDLGHFDVADNFGRDKQQIIKQVVLQDYAKTLLYMTGVYIDSNIDEIVTQYLSLPIVLTPPEEGKEIFDGRG
jgi:hypothetical protein